MNFIIGETLTKRLSKGDLTNFCLELEVIVIGISRVILKYSMYFQQCQIILVIHKNIKLLEFIQNSRDNQHEKSQVGSDWQNAKFH